MTATYAENGARRLAPHLEQAGAGGRQPPYGGASSQASALTAERRRSEPADRLAAGLGLPELRRSAERQHPRRVRPAGSTPRRGYLRTPPADAASSPASPRRPVGPILPRSAGRD